MRRVHIVFGENFASWVNHLLLNRGDHSDIVINVDEFLSYGPLTHLDTEDGLMRRIGWFEKTLNQQEYDKYLSERKHQSKLLSMIKADDDITVWRGNCVGDYLGTLYIATRLAGIKIQLIDYDVNSKPLSDEILSVLYEQRKLLPRNEHHLLINEWLHWQRDSGLLRIYNDNMIIESVRTDYFDAMILDALDSNALSKKELLTSVLIKDKASLPKSFYQWRIDKLITQSYINRSMDSESLTIQKGVL